MGCVAISLDKAEELAKNFSTTTANQVFCLFNTWFKQYSKRESRNKVNVEFKCIVKDHIYNISLKYLILFQTKCNFIIIVKYI